jgi:hypothetical protein
MLSRFDVQGGPLAPPKIANVNGTFADLAGTRTGLYVDVTAATVGTGGATGSWSEVRTSANAGTYTNAISGSFAEAKHEGNATADHLIGAMTLANQTGAGTVTNAYGLYPQVWKGAGTVINAYGLYFPGVPSINGDTNVGLGTVTNQYGISIANLSQGTSRNIGLLLDDTAPGANVTGDFGIVQESGDANSFSGNVGIGTNEVPAQLTLHSTGNDLIDSRTNEDLTGANAIESRYYVGTATGNRAAPSKVNDFRFFAGFGGFQEVVAISINTPQILLGTGIGAVDFKTQGADGLVPRLTVNDQGALFPQKVGIGTTAPRGPLEVDGNIYVMAGGNVGIGTWQPLAGVQVGAGMNTLGATLDNTGALIKGNLEVDAKIYGAAFTLPTGPSVTAISNNTLLTGDSGTSLVTEHAVKGYVDGAVINGGVGDITAVGPDRIRGSGDRCREHPGCQCRHRHDRAAGRARGRFGCHAHISFQHFQRLHPG